MYAAAGGASIANRRKQKRLQLNKQGGGAATPQQVAPLSPIQFPISPPPLSLESSVSATTCPNNNNKASNFPFPPPSILDLRVSPPTSEPQCGGQGPGGKAAWQGCNRPSLPLSPTSPGCRGEGYKTKQCEAHRRWMKRNRIRDASYCYGSSGEDEEEDDSSNAVRHRGEVSAAVNTVLYAGLGTTALGLIISFVGTGEKGFLSPELRLVGPSLLCVGLLCCLFRVLLCLCLCRCGSCRWRFCQVASHKKEKARKAEARPTGTLSTASLLPPAQQEHQQQSQQQQRHHQQDRQPTAPMSRSVSPATKGHELLLSPAQLPE
ncbi:hypothetical protein EAI_10557 [Harpegnathos saltator]|uniref:Uncharacterized protein n=1 Tax=Harpegnathos saltator TaxID=610380 RepID=E2B7R0_HARSA|nr:hypothetical protein EAI_10557 [Harpegnathos saltator]